ncbi:hypothetical protein DSECCO2_576690 [anaerobic digester metagenome]
MWFCMPGSCPGFLTYIERTMAADAALVMARPTASKYSVFIFLVFGLYTVFLPAASSAGEFLCLENLLNAESALCHNGDRHDEKVYSKRFHKNSAMV